LFGDEINEGMRILQIADIFCALTEKRPYRGSLSAQQLTDELTKMVSQKKLEAAPVGLVTSRIELFMALVDKDV